MERITKNTKRMFMNKKNLTLLLLLTTNLIAIELEPIEVSSPKLESVLLDNSMSIDVLDEKKLNIANIKKIDDFSALIPNVNISGLGNRSDKTFTVRGVGNYLSIESSVAMYVDDIPVPFSSGFGLVNMQNLKSMEFLKGAQGTLFGKGASSGVINIYTPDPSETLKGKVSVGLGTQNRQEYYMHLSGPTTFDDLAYSISVSKQKNDGFSKNKLTGDNFDKQSSLNFDAKLKYNPDSPLNIALLYKQSSSDDGGAPFKLNTKDEPFIIDNEPQNDTLTSKTQQLGLVLKYEEDDYLLSSSTSIAKQSIEHFNYLDILGGFTMNRVTEIEEITQELKAKKELESSDFLVGFFYSDKTKFKFEEEQVILSVPLASNNDLDNPDENIAIFSQYKHYFGEDYEMMLGLRYQETKRTFSQSLNNFGEATQTASDSHTWRHFLPTFSFSYYPEEESLIYFKYAKGYRPGGYYYRQINNLEPFQPELLDSYELAYKTSFDNKVALNTVLFYNYIKEHRINALADNLSSIALSARRAESYGFEIDASYRGDNVEIFSSLGITKTAIKDFDGETSLYKNNKIIEVPNMTAALGGQYDFNNVFVKGMIRYMGERYYNVQNSVKEDAYSLTNVAIGYTKNDWEVELYANNVFDEEYVDLVVYTPSNNFYHFGPSRVVVVSLSKAF